MPDAIQPQSFSHLAKKLLAGGAAGCCAKTAVAPLDRIKILLQGHNHHYKHLGVVSSLRQVKNKEGFFSLYKGNGVHMLRVFPYAAIQFTSFDIFYKGLRNLYGDDHIHLIRLTAGAVAGPTAVLFTYPLDFVRARLAFQVSGEHIYTGLVDALRSITSQEGGVRALYRGIVPSLLGMVPYAGTSFYSFETLKDLSLKNFPDYVARPSSTNPDKLVLIMPAKVVFGGIAGAMGQTLAYPLDVVRRRVQLARMLPDSDKYRRRWYQILIMIYKEDGVPRGLYRGMSINYLRGAPMYAVSFTMNEILKEMFGLDTSS
ncbi:graves disease carrier protein-like [Mizuhopecten yessoensis]|uniref:Graves disease carrier protein n=1 Tax=Mizuhopecten yessoensis TaxID=6573 RepID=A0A210QSY9_MIZYE|nr:graves disease carrier protein-like [Mizuhopecten yessoensis]OWF51841.1 Graves disease carrier protein [Mizuhopecten yessoensis]